MEAFSLLKYWRGGGGGGGDPRAASVPATTIFATASATAVPRSSPETDDDDDDDDGDDGPFFDLEFAPVPDDEDDEEKPEVEEEERRKQDEPGNDEDDSASECGGGDDVDREFDFTLSSGSSGSSHDCTDANIASSLSPSDDLFFKGKLVPIEPSSDPDSTKPPSFAAAASLLKSATKFRVFMLGLKKSKPMNTLEKAEKTETSEEPCLTVITPPQRARAQERGNNNKQSSSSSNKFLTVKFKVEEVPLVSLFTRDNSSRSASGAKPPQKQTSEEDAASGDERRFAREAMRRYLKKVKPFYIRVSKRYGERLGLSGQLGHTVFEPTVGEKSRSKASAVAEVGSSGHGSSQRQGQGQGQGSSSIPAGLRVVCKHLGKSRSASSAVAAAPGGQAAAAAASRRDDSLLQQQDGIQSAILHCKRSFNASRDSESSLLARSVSDPLRKDASRSSPEDGK
ncbi:probable membrane-associated kinase regulator 2 [Syzygium oleosum]|uniref:probable membrane-associated kinase regulator 2 n=1 Tax=Syzygium oleosum TaxID=219896 RepID=UPI0011D28D77|nr:probable membrane-associated kinase regulator 2 [Syzygium oleosum]